jgi:hypothetical protein
MYMVAVTIRPHAPPPLPYPSAEVATALLQASFTVDEPLEHVRLKAEDGAITAVLFLRAPTRRDATAAARRLLLRALARSRYLDGWVLDEDGT